MGYMGLGLQKWIYTQKPRKSFTTLKKMYEKELYKKNQHKVPQEFPQQVSLSMADKLAIRQQIKKERNKSLGLKLTILSFSILIAVFFAFYLFPLIFKFLQVF